MWNFSPSSHHSLQCCAPKPRTRGLPVASACAEALSEWKELPPDRGLRLGPCEPPRPAQPQERSGGLSGPSPLCWPAWVTHFPPLHVVIIEVTYQQICKLSTLYLCREQILQRGGQPSVSQWLDLPALPLCQHGSSFVIYTERELITIVYLTGASW